MTPTQSPLRSRTVWSAVITLVAVIAGQFGAEFAPDEQAVVLEGVTTIVAAVGSIAAVYFRIVARKTVT